MAYVGVRRRKATEELQKECRNVYLRGTRGEGFFPRLPDSRDFQDRFNEQCHVWPRCPVK